jgi:hypothetical protein
MMQRLVFLLLIGILPIQSWAVADMCLQKGSAQLSLVQSPSESIHYACHELSSEVDSEAFVANADQVPNCASCSLCMSFGSLLLPHLVLRFDSPSQSFYTSDLIFLSEDHLKAIKPPII